VRTFRVGLATLCLVLVAGACSDGDGSSPVDGAAQGQTVPPPTAHDQPGTSGAAADAGSTPAANGTADGSADRPTDGAADGGSAAADAADCPAAEKPVTPDGPTNTAKVVQAGSDGEPRVEMVLYPRPNHTGNPWSQWGQGIVTADGRFLSAMGDHLGVDGDAYLFVYDPATEALTRFADVGQVIGHQTGDWGYGKIHAQMVAGPCGVVYASTYWGTRTKIQYNDRYTGDELLRIDPATLEVTPLGAPIPKHGLPSMAAGPDGRLYVEAVDSSSSTDEDHGAFAVIDPSTDPPTVEFQDDSAAHAGFRTILVGADHQAYVADRTGGVLTYDPAKGTLAKSSLDLGAGILRAATTPMPDGTVWAITDGPEAIYRVDPDGSTHELATVDGYTASLARTPDGSRLFWVPGAHGNANADGTPVMTIDTKTGEVDTLVSLDALGVQAFGLHLGGSYDVAVDPTGKTLYVGLNGGQDPEKPWGEVVLAVISLNGVGQDPS
jgi:hypothetical protein